MLFLFYSPSLSSVCLVCFNNYPTCFKISYWIVSYLKSLLANDSAYCGGISTFLFLHLFLWSKKIVQARQLFQVLACKLSSHCYILMDNLPLKQGGVGGFGNLTFILWWLLGSSLLTKYNFPLGLVCIRRHSVLLMLFLGGWGGWCCSVSAGTAWGL